MLKRRTLLLPGIILFVSLAATFMYAAGSDQKAGASQTVTGCLQKGLENTGYFLLTADGQHWELYPDQQSFPGRARRPYGNRDRHRGQAIGGTRGKKPTL